MIDRSYIGRTLPSFSVKIEPFQLRLFAKAIGETRPEYLDEEHARAIGLPGLLAPPTFVFSIWLQDPVPFRMVTKLGLDMDRVLHGEQSFTFRSPFHSGDIVRITERIADVYERKNGLLVFIVSEILADTPANVPLAEARCVTVVRH
jgi:acyl dehydratase